MAKRSSPYDLDSLTDVALGVFRERGYDATSMENLAAAAGISKAAFYHHVGGKEDLLQRGFDRALDALFRVFDEAGATAGSAMDQVRFVIRRLIQLEDSLLPEVSVLLRTRGNSTVESDALAKRRLFDGRLASLIASAQDDGSMRTDIDAHLAARLMIGMCTWIVEWWQPGGVLSSDQLADAALAMAFEGLAVRGSDSDTPLNGQVIPSQAEATSRLVASKVVVSKVVVSKVVASKVAVASKVVASKVAVASKAVATPPRPRSGR